MSFDDLNATEDEFWYKIEHMTYDWKPSAIFSNEYIEGFQENVITSIEQSFNTLQNYTHYKVQFPNRNTRILKSGNYLLTVKNADSKVLFTRKFVLYENRVIVGVNAIRGRNTHTNDQKQTVQFTVNYNPNSIRNPGVELKTTILQNDIWETAISDLKPQFFRANQLVYKYLEKSSFWGGNEYLNFDNKQIRNSTIQIAHVEKKDIYNSYLYPQERRSFKPYTYFPDINGQFLIRTIEAENNDTEADYSLIHFTLNTNKIANKAVYVFGAFNNFELSDENKMSYNKNSNSYEASILLKQGFYNYTFVTKENNKPTNLHEINGSHFETENEYKVIVYQKAFGENYYRAIGVGSKTINPQQ